MTGKVPRNRFGELQSRLRGLHPPCACRSDVPSSPTLVDAKVQGRSVLRLRLTAYLLVLLALLPPMGLSIAAVAPSASEPDDLDAWIGQMIMLGFRGTALEPGSPVLEDIRTIRPGGVVLFDYDVAQSSPVRNIVSAEQVQSLVTTLQRESKVPLLVAIDQEGGRIARLKPRHGFSETRSQSSLGRADREAETRRQAREIAGTLSALGINLNFSPVLDLAVNPDNPVIARLERSFGPDPRLVERHARWTIEEHQAKKVLSAVKHFPGHGSSREDSHLGLPDVTEVWSESELEPFATLISEGLPAMVMTAHLFNRKWDPEYPATLSRKVLTGMLREQLGFDGVIVSDDMQMGAIARHFGFEQSLRKAVEAGVDLLVFANNSRDFDPNIGRRAFESLRALVRSGAISERRVRESHDRILALKERTGILGKR